MPRPECWTWYFELTLYLSSLGGDILLLGEKNSEERMSFQNDISEQCWRHWSLGEPQALSPFSAHLLFSVLLLHCLSWTHLLLFFYLFHLEYSLSYLGGSADSVDTGPNCSCYHEKLHGSGMLWRVCAVACGDNDDGSLLASTEQQRPALGDFCTTELSAPARYCGQRWRNWGLEKPINLPRTPQTLVLKVGFWGPGFRKWACAIPHCSPALDILSFGYLYLLFPVTQGRNHILWHRDLLF